MGTQPRSEWERPALAGDVALVVSELMTNALLHGSLRDRVIRVRITVTGVTLRVDVSDPRGERLPNPCPAGDTDQFGRGPLLVGALSHRWGWEPRWREGVTGAALAWARPTRALGERKGRPMTMPYAEGDAPLIPRPDLTLPALRQAVATVVPSRLPEFFEDVRRAFVRAGDEDSVVPIRMFHREWGVIVEMERHPETARRRAGDQQRRRLRTRPCHPRSRRDRRTRVHGPSSGLVRPAVHRSRDGEEWGSNR
ncbi:ATP-binding protein [Streptomyces sp. NBC_01261]|uniref:ATP-binding protein n=1 Tax=Streptomyces sp. NBC_01261 TaxID=2903802 RepID=UPI002E346DF8|nr:ATP-binding protein [Streptomyces sp. NBC_01261]